MNEAEKYIKEIAAFHTPFKFTEDEVKTAVNKALEQVGKEAKEKKRIYPGLSFVSIEDLDEIINNLKL